MARISAAERLAQDIDPSLSAAARRATWTLAEAKANLDLGYAPERVSEMTGWPELLLTHSLPAARKEWERMVAAQAAARAQAEEVDQDQADAEFLARLDALLERRSWTREGLLTELAQELPEEEDEEELVPGDVETTMADVLVEVLEAREEAAEPLAEFEGLVEDVPEAGYDSEAQASVELDESTEGAHTAKGPVSTPVQTVEPQSDLRDAEVIQHPARRQRSTDNLTWSDEALAFVETYGMRDVIEAAAHYPTSIGIDPHQADVDYPIERRRRGDVEVTIGYRYENEPKILFVHLFTGDNYHQQAPVGKKNPGKPVGTYPLTRNDLIKRAMEMGYIPNYNRDTTLVWRDGRKALVVPRGAADRKEILKAWNDLKKWHREHVDELPAEEMAH